MADKRQLELYLLRFLPHALRDDFVTVGLFLLESDGGFADIRVTRDLKMLQCVAPDVELEWFQLIEKEIRSRIASLRRREDLIDLVNGKFGTLIDVAPPKAVLTEDPAREMELLTSMYLVPTERGERIQHRTGRGAIVNLMREAFETAGLLELMQMNLDVGKYTGAGDPFRIDFGFRAGETVQMFHAVSVIANVDQALALAHRYSLIDAGMRRERISPSLIAVLDRGKDSQEERTAFAIGMLAQSSVQVKTVDEVTEIAIRARQDLRM